MRITAITLVAMVCLLSGCGSFGPGENGASGAARLGYPAGPYGTGVDSVIDDLELTDSDGTVFSLHEIYQDGSNRLLLINTAAGWCGACIEEQPALQELHDSHHAQGLYTLVAIFEDSQFRPADAAIARSWKEQYNLELRVTADPNFKLSQYYDRSLTPMNMLIDVDTMSILRIGTGWDPGAIEAIVEARL